jgi:hypothetical protein
VDLAGSDRLVYPRELAIASERTCHRIQTSFYYELICARMCAECDALRFVLPFKFITFASMTTYRAPVRSSAAPLRSSKSCPNMVHAFVSSWIKVRNKKVCFPVIVGVHLYSLLFKALYLQSMLLGGPTSVLDVTTILPNTVRAVFVSSGETERCSASLWVFGTFIGVFTSIHCQKAGGAGGVRAKSWTCNCYFVHVNIINLLLRQCASSVNYGSSILMFSFHAP